MNFSTTFGFLVAGGGLLVVAEFSPAFATGTMAIIILGVLVSDPNFFASVNQIFTGTIPEPQEQRK